MITYQFIGEVKTIKCDNGFYTFQFRGIRPANEGSYYADKAENPTPKAATILKEDQSFWAPSGIANLIINHSDKRLRITFIDGASLSKWIQESVNATLNEIDCSLKTEKKGGRKQPQTDEAIEAIKEIKDNFKSIKDASQKLSGRQIKDCYQILSVVLEH